MSGRGDDKAEQLLGAALAAGPLDVLDLLRALRRDLPGPLGRQEGAVHALVHRLVRAGEVEVGGTSPRGLTLYRAARSTAPGEAPAPPEPGPLEPGLAKRALHVAAAVRDPGHRGRILADVIAHLTELTETGHVERFGAPRIARALLERVDRGKAAVVLPADGGDRVRRLVLHEGPWLLCAVLVFLVLKLFVVSPFKIPSDSMVPTLVRGDRVAVFTVFRQDVPDRWDVAVFERDGVHYVKRLVGLPGESIALWYGDVYVNGSLVRKPPELCEALRTDVGRWPLVEAAAQGWQVKEIDGARHWIWTAGTFSAFPSGYREFPMHDGYAVLEGDRGDGTVELALIRGPGPLGDRSVRWTLRAAPEGLELGEQATDGTNVAPAQVLARGPRPPGGAALRVSFIDGVLRASCGGWSFEQERAEAPIAPLGVGLVTRGVEEAGLTLVVDRDHHYAHGQGTSHGTPTPSAERPTDFDHPIAADRSYFLGDNTTNSQDSRFREVGDIPLEDIVGSVSIRIWPPGRWGRVR